MKNKFCILFSLLSLPIFAQPLVFTQDSTHTWAGGLNSPQVQTLDLNQDGRQDLVIFDRTASRFLTFLALPTEAGKMQWQYAPFYETIFPKTQGWFILRDYNQDGIKDFFAHAPLGMQGWKAVKKNNLLQFQPFQGEGIYTQGLSGRVNLQIAITDIPCLHDFNHDGKLDVLTFDFAQGNYLELHLNISENKDDFLLKRQGYCWGNIWEGTNCGDLRLDYPCEGGKGGGEALARPLHTGSTISVQDLDQDQRLDILVGDVSCKRLYAIYNKGTDLKPVFHKIDTLFPASKPVEMAIFPASFVEDVNFDAIPDLLVAPNVFRNEENQIDFQHTLWLYTGKKKRKKIVYEFQTEAFLQQNMLDVGENAAPVLWDYDADGDFDLLVGNRGLRRQGTFKATLQLFENIGTPQKPQFQLKNDDFGELASQMLTDIRPFMSDYPQKNTLHVLAYQKDLVVWLYKESASSNWQIFPYNLGKREFPILYDFDQDKDIDLLISTPQNQWNFLENTSPSTVPQFEVKNLELRLPKMNHTLQEKYFVVADLNGDGQTDFLIEDEGNLILYSDMMAQMRQKEIWLGDKAIFRNKIQLGSFVYPALADLDADGRLDMIVGLRTGGIALFWNKLY